MKGTVAWVEIKSDDIKILTNQPQGESNFKKLNI